MSKSEARKLLVELNRPGGYFNPPYNEKIRLARAKARRERARAAKYERERLRGQPHPHPVPLPERYTDIARAALDSAEPGR